MNRKQTIIFMGVIFLIISLPLLIYSKKLNILNPNMKPSAGEWGGPAHRIGEKPKEMWTASTLEAAINKKPLDGKITTRTGELIDVSCYLQLGKHGKEHEACAKGCLLNGQPLGLLDEEGTVYILIPEEHGPRRDGKTALKEALIEHVAQIVEVTGTLTNVKGLKTLYVQGFVKK